MANDVTDGTTTLRARALADRGAGAPVDWLGEPRVRGAFALVQRRCDADVMVVRNR